MMDNELIPEKTWWQRNWKWLIPSCLIVLFGLLIINSILNISQREAENAMAFDKTKWATKNETGYPYRNKILKELMANDTLKCLQKQQILNMLGDPDRSDNDYLFYTIAQERLGFFPMHTKTLVIKLSDNAANKVMIHQ